MGARKGVKYINIPIRDGYVIAAQAASRFLLWVRSLVNV